MRSALFAAVLLLPPLTAGAAPAPICGDVNASSSVTSSDALLVLKKGVGQIVALNCSGYESAVSQCMSTLDTCNADLASCLAAPVCGNGKVEAGETCDGPDLNGQDCASLGYGNGSLKCSASCTLDESACWDQRFDAAGATLIDRVTGLEWERKEALDLTPSPANPHDADNQLTWSADGTGATNGTAFSAFLGRLNSAWSLEGDSSTGCYAGHCDWRLPTIEELRTILAEPCSSAPCVVDPGMTNQQDKAYWSATTKAGDAPTAWTVNFGTGSIATAAKSGSAYVRAVRGGKPGSSFDCQGTMVYGRCWFFGADNLSCDDVCGDAAMIYDPATLKLTGSDGTDALCLEVMNAVGAPGSGLTWPSTSYSVGIGCAEDPTNARAHVISTPTTSSAKDSGIRRLCACLPNP